MKNIKSKLKNKRKKVIISVVGVVATMMAIGFAWFTFSDRLADTDDIPVMASYSLYLLNSDATDYLQLTIGNIHPGEDKKIVFSVSSLQPGNDQNGDIQVNRESTFDYELEMAYTENLPIKYSLYQLEEAQADDSSDDVIAVTNSDNSISKWKKAAVALTGDDSVTDARREEMYGENLEGIINLGKYWLYAKDPQNKPLQLATAPDNSRYANNYYLLEITWKDQNINFSNYTKETDLFYIIVKALQPKPIEK